MTLLFASSLLRLVFCLAALVTSQELIHLLECVIYLSGQLRFFSLTILCQTITSQLALISLLLANKLESIYYLQSFFPLLMVTHLWWITGQLYKLGFGPVSGPASMWTFSLPLASRTGGKSRPLSQQTKLVCVIGESRKRWGYNSVHQTNMLYQ